MVALLTIISLISMVVCYAIAKSRSADRVYWVLMGLLLGPLAIPFAFWAKPKAD